MVASNSTNDIVYGCEDSLAPDCRTEGCETPAAWCEAHHVTPWSRNGRSDLEDGVLLCPFHHHRAHDARYDMSRLPNGDHRFHRRT